MNNQAQKYSPVLETISPLSLTMPCSLFKKKLVCIVTVNDEVVRSPEFSLMLVFDGQSGGAVKHKIPY